MLNDRVLRFTSTTLLTIVMTMAMTIAMTSPAEAQKRADPASLTLATKVHDAPSSNAAVVGDLPAGESVTVLKMSGAYARIKASSVQGWILASRLHIGDSKSSASGDSSGSGWLRSLSGMLGGSSQKKGRDAKVPIGIRGMQKEDVANAQPNPGAVQRLESYAVSANDARRKSQALGLHAIDKAHVQTSVAPVLDTSEDTQGSDR